MKILNTVPKKWRSIFGTLGGEPPAVGGWRLAVGPDASNSEGEKTSLFEDCEGLVRVPSLFSFSRRVQLSAHHLPLAC